MSNPIPHVYLALKFPINYRSQEYRKRRVTSCRFFLCSSTSRRVASYRLKRMKRVAVALLTNTQRQIHIIHFDTTHIDTTNTYIIHTYTAYFNTIYDLFHVFA